MQAATQAYCGNPPVPGATTWNLDPVLLVALAVIAGAYALAALPARLSRGRQACFQAGWLIVALALVSPLCNLSVALFSARVTQHMIIALVGAPLLVAGRGEVLLSAVARLLRGRPGGRLRAGPAGLPFHPSELALGPAAFALALWVWHLGLPYDATLQSTPLYWLMHASLFASALMLWRAVLLAPPLASLGASFFTGLQMTALGALLTLSPRTWFHAHEATTWAWGQSPLQDQQLGGLIMWVPAGTLLLGHAVAMLGLVLLRLSRQHAGAGSAGPA